MDHGRLRWAIQEFWIRAKRRFSIIFFNVEVIFWTNVLSQKSNLYHVNLMQWTLFTPSKAQAQPSRESEQVGQNWKKNVLWFVNIVITFYDFHKLVIGVIFLSFILTASTDFLCDIIWCIVQVELGGEGDHPVLEASLLRRYSKV